MNVAPSKASPGSAASGFSSVGPYSLLQAKLTPVDAELRLGRPTKLILEVTAPAPAPIPAGDSWNGDDAPFTPAAKTLEIRFTLHSPDRGFLTGASASRGRQGTFSVTEGEVTRIELEAQPVKREGKLRLSLYTQRELDLIGDYDLTLKAT